MSENARRLPRLGLGFMAACVSAVGLYGALRILQAHMFPEPNPATIIWSAHSGYYWRCWTVCYAGAMLGFLAYGAAKRYESDVARWLMRALPVAIVAIVLQAVLVP